MIDSVLIVVDIQNGFITNDETKETVRKIEELLKDKVFKYVVATRFINKDGSIYERLMEWEGLKSKDEQQLIDTVEECAEIIVNKEVYSCVGNEFIRQLSWLYNGKTVNEVYICGIDTECCVLKIATDLFENGIRPIVLVDYCASTGGTEAHNAGIKCMERLLGRKQLIHGKMIHKN